MQRQACQRQAGRASSRRAGFVSVRVRLRAAARQALEPADAQGPCRSSGAGRDGMAARASSKPAEPALRQTRGT